MIFTACDTSPAIPLILYNDFSILSSKVPSKYTNKNYNASDDVEQIISGSVVESWEWWKPVLYDLNIVAYGGAAIWIYFVVKGIILLNMKRDEGLDI